MAQFFGVQGCFVRFVFVLFEGHCRLGTLAQQEIGCLISSIFFIGTVSYQ